MSRTSMFLRLCKAQVFLARWAKDGVVILLVLPRLFSHCPRVHGTPERDCLVVIDDYPSVTSSFLSLPLLIITMISCSRAHENHL